MVSSPFIVIVFEELLVKEPGLSIISSEPLSIVSVPVVSVNGIFSVTITFPSMIISSEPAGSMSLLQLSAFDQESSSPAPPSQIPFASGGATPKTEISLSRFSATKISVLSLTNS